MSICYGSTKKLIQPVFIENQIFVESGSVEARAIKVDFILKKIVTKTS